MAKRATTPTPTDPSAPAAQSTAPAQAATKPPKVLVAGLSKKNPLVPFVDQIIKTVIWPHLAKAVQSFGETGVPSIKALTDRFNANTGSKVSPNMLKAWLKYCGYVFKTQPTLVSVNPPTAAAGSSTTTAGEEEVVFDKAPTMAGGPQ